ncbi:hypothetical protein Tco_0388597 [Tanacetum coccineum]
MTESPLMDSGFAVPVFSPRDDPIAYLNKTMTFLTAVASSRFPSTNNQLKVPFLKTCALRKQSTVRLTVGLSPTIILRRESNIVWALEARIGVAMAHASWVQCNKYRGDKVKVILVLGIRVMLLALWEIMQVDRQGLLNATTIKVKDISLGNALSLSEQGMQHDLGVPDGQVVQTIIPNTAAFQTEDLDTYDSDYDDLSNAQAVLMANIFNYGSDVISEEKANKEHNNESVTAELERYKERVKTFEQRLNIDLSSHEKMIDSQMDDMITEKLALKEQVDSLEQNLSKQMKEKECLLQTFIVFKSESKEKDDKYMENEIDLEKKIKELDNILFKVIKIRFILRKLSGLNQTCMMVSDKHVAMPVIDDEETLILEEKSRSKMSEKAKDPKIIDKNISHKPIDYEKLNRLSKDFGKRFTLQQEMDAEQAFCLVNESLKKLKLHLAKFDNVVKIKTTPDARTEGLKCSTSKCGSKPIGNKRNDRISQKPSRNMKNKVEAQPRKVNKKSCVVKPVHDVNVKHSLLHANSEPSLIEFKNANHSEPNHTWGSNATDIPSSSSSVMTSCPDCSLVSGLRMFKTHDRESLSAHELSSKTKSWLWHRRLSHLNFGKSKKSCHQTKAKDTNQEKLYLLHMDLCGPMRVAIINGKRHGYAVSSLMDTAYWSSE